MPNPSKAGEKPAKPAAAKVAKPKAPKPKVAEAKEAKAVTKAVAKAAPVKAPVKKAAAKPASTKKPASAAKKVTTPKLSAEQRRFYVEVAAYYIAERRGFHGSSQLDDWVQAEAEIDRLLQEGILKP